MRRRKRADDEDAGGHGTIGSMKINLLAFGDHEALVSGIEPSDTHGHCCAGVCPLRQRCDLVGEERVDGWLLRDLRLDADETGIDAVGLEQVRMRALLHEPAPVEGQDAVGISKC